MHGAAITELALSSRAYQEEEEEEAVARTAYYFRVCSMNLLDALGFSQQISSKCVHDGSDSLRLLAFTRE